MTVDIETGVVRMNRLVAVQDCGMIINPKTAENQIYGACTMSIGGALYEERVIDDQTGRVLNANSTFYKLTFAGDFGEIIPVLDIRPEHDKRGVIGLGEPPVDSGHRRHRQCRCQRHRRARSAGADDARPGPRGPGKEERLMQPFEYASPTTLKEALPLLGGQWGETAVLAGGTDLLSLMKDYIETPKRVVNIKGIKELAGIRKTAAGLRIGALATFAELIGSPLVRAGYPSLVTAAEGVSSPQIRNMGTVAGDLCQRPRCWYFRAGYGLLNDPCP